MHKIPSSLTTQFKVFDGDISTRLCGVLIQIPGARCFGAINKLVRCSLVGGHKLTVTRYTLRCWYDIQVLFICVLCVNEFQFSSSVALILLIDHRGIFWLLRLRKYPRYIISYSIQFVVENISESSALSGLISTESWLVLRRIKGNNI